MLFLFLAFISSLRIFQHKHSIHNCTDPLSNQEFVGGAVLGDSFADFRNDSSLFISNTIFRSITCNAILDCEEVNATIQDCLIEDCTNYFSTIFIYSANSSNNLQGVVVNTSIRRTTNTAVNPEYYSNIYAKVKIITLQDCSVIFDGPTTNKSALCIKQDQAEASCIIAGFFSQYTSTYAKNKESIRIEIANSPSVFEVANCYFSHLSSTHHPIVCFSLPFPGDIDNITFDSCSEHKASFSSQIAESSFTLNNWNFINSNPNIEGTISLTYSNCLFQGTSETPREQISISGNDRNFLNCSFKDYIVSNNGYIFSLSSITNNLIFDCLRFEFTDKDHSCGAIYL